MGRGKFKGKPTGRRNFSHPDDIAISLCISEELYSTFAPEVAESLSAGNFTRPRTFKRVEAEEEIEEVSEEEELEEEPEKRKGTEGIIEIKNPNFEKAKNVKAKDVDMERKTELSRREREEIEKQKAHERYMRLQEQGKTEQARKDLERLAMIRQQRAEAAKKREQDKAAKEQKKAEPRK